MRESEERFRTLVSIITDVPWTPDASGGFVEPQPAWAAYTGQTYDELCGFGWADSLHPEDRLPVRGAWDRARSSGSLYQMGARVWHAGTQEYRHVESRATPIADPDGSVREWVGACTDVEEQKRAEERLRKSAEELRASNDRLSRSNEDLARFAFIASHDLQEPLRMITLYAELLATEYQGRNESDVVMYVGNIVDGTRRMRDLIADLLTYTAVRGEAEESLEVVDLNSVIETVQLNLKASIDDSGAVITSDPLPVITAHATHAVALFQNLIGNAIKYRSEEPPRVHISVREAEGELRFAVRDNGIGIAREYHETIFVAFKRLHARQIPGAGIGLAICQRVLERYGGRIWVESEVGRGATFHFVLPNIAVQSA